MAARTLGEQQRRFVLLKAKLIEWAYANGYELTDGEAWRTPEQAAWNAQHGSGIANSLHCERLAQDYNLFKGGVLLETKEDYQPLGDYWKTLDPDCRWGGDFHKPDSDHFSLTWQGVS